MNAGININLFENFELNKDGAPILESLSNTRKTKLFLAYLILNKNRIIAHRELFELLWSGQEYSNPGTALRTLLYRYRTLISEKGYSELEDSVLSKRGAYQWNSDINVSIDIFDFEDYSEIGLNHSVSEDKREECLKFAIDLYKGPLLREFSEEHWVVPKAVYYRDLYIEDVCEYVELLKENSRHDEIKAVLEKAVEKAGHCDLVDAELEMVNSGKNFTGTALDKYQILKSHEGFMGEEIDKLQKGMEIEEESGSAFVCDFEMFKEVYHLQRRLLARTGETMYVSLITVGFTGETDTDSLKTERIMKALLDSTRRCLRCGDSVCRYSDYCLAVMFPAGAYDDAVKILERIRNRFFKAIQSGDIVLSYRIRPLKNITD